MRSRQPTVSVTPEGLVISIPWRAVGLESSGPARRRRRLTVDDVLDFVEAGRLAGQLGLTRTVQSLKVRNRAKIARASQAIDRLRRKPPRGWNSVEVLRKLREAR
jgi:hypothetical protein